MATVLRQLYDAYDTGLGEHNNEYEFRVQIGPHAQRQLPTYVFRYSYGLVSVTDRDAVVCWPEKIRQHLMHELRQGSVVRLFTYHRDDHREVRVHFDSTEHYQSEHEQRQAFFS